MRNPQPRSRASSAPALRAFVLWLRAHARLTMLLLLVASGILGPLAQNAGTLFPTAAAHGLTTQTTQANPKPFDPHANSTSINHQPPGAAPRVTRATDTPAPMSPPSGITMPQGLLPLNPNAAATFRGKDGRFELDAPAGAITAADQAAAGGALQLAIRQVAPASGSSAGGSGLVSFGQYLVQVVDGSGVLVAQGLRKPVTIKMHMPAAASALDLGRAFVVFNSSPPVGVSSAPTSASSPDARSGASVSGKVPGLGAFSSQRADYDPMQQTLSTTYTLSGPSALMSFDTNSSVATFSHPDPFNVDLNAGGLTTSIPLDVPSGPGGLTPPVALTYSSAGVSEQHNIQAAAGWAGEGWNLSFGSITWAEHNSNATCASGCGNGWEDTWELSDPFGTSVELIPPNINVATYFDDSANPISTSPIRWHAAPENYAKIYSYTSSLTLPDGGGVAPPCFRVFLPNGIMEEFGCTADSLEYYTSDTSGTVHDFIDAWNLDLITDPQGNQIHITYQQDIAGSVNHYVRDAEPATVEWDSPTCHDAQQMCPAATWAPLMRVQFNASYAIPSSHILSMGAQPCNTSWHLRCDDPLDLSGSGGVGAPGVVSTLALLDAYVQVRTTSTGSWNTLKDYQFVYNQQGPRTTTDPTTGDPISAAGYFLLERLNVVGMNGVSLPTSSFEYSSQSQTYVDSNFYPTPSTNCGPSWNTGTGNGCFLWSQNQTGNSYFLASYENGMGLHEDFSWQLARNNTHGVPSGGQPYNPFWCNGYQTRSPCQEADDQNWSRVVLTKTESSVLRATSAGNVEVDSATVMGYVLTPLVAQECTDCKQGMYWGNQNDGDYLDYYNAKFMGFAQANVSNPDGSVVEHHYDSTEGYGVYDSSVPCLAFIKPCHNAPWWDLTNAAHGHETETDYYDTDGATLLRQDKASYSVTCPPSGVSGSPSWSTTVNGSPYTYTWDGRLVAALDHGNPVAVCAVRLTQSLTNTFNGSSNYARSWTNYGYDSYGRLTDATANANDGGGTGSPTVIRTHSDYIWNDNVSANSTSATGHYLLDFPIQSYITDSASDLRTSCMRYQYDGNGYIYGQQSGLTLGEVTSSNSATDCGSVSNGWTPSGVMRTTTAYDSYGNVVATTDPLGVAGNSAHLGCALSGVNYTDCLTYDSIYHTQVVSETNTLGQTSQIAYATDASGGYGLWPTSATDPNGAVTSSAYDGLGRLTSETLPGETSGLTTQTWTYVVTCGGAGSGPQAPCVRVDQTQRVDATTTVAAHAFYNGYGQLAETRDQAPGGQDVVRFTEFDAATRAFRVSNPYFVPAWDGVTGFGYNADDVNQVPTTSSYDGLGRTLTTTDPLYNVTTTSYGVTCNVTSGDSSCYAATNVTDANAHQSQSFTDAFGRTAYTRDLSGNGGNVPYATYRTLAATYDYAGNETTITQPNGSTTTFGYDAAGRQVWMTDPDRGHESYAYDADGNVVTVTDARNESVYAGYDGLNRQVWRNTLDTPNNAYLSYDYDQSGHGSSIGRLTSEQFVSPSDTSLTGSYSYTYDARGQVTNTTTTLLGANYSVSTTYDDAGEPLSVTYPDGAVASTSYSQDWLAGVSWTQSGTTTPILAAVSYSGQAGAFGAITSANVGQNAGAALYRYFGQLDRDGRLVADELVKINTGAMLDDEQIHYDPVGNVSAVTTVLPAGTDNQLFCYDEQNRLTWAGTTTGNPCGNGAATGTFGTAGYTETFSYDTLNRLTNSPLGSYSYEDSAHLHAATSVSGGNGAYSASYDASGNMTCRAPSSSAACAGTPKTGQALTWDVEGRLATWQNTTTAPTVTTKYLYDGEGNRVVQQVVDTSTGTTTTTTTSYIGSLETHTQTLVSGGPGTISSTDYIPAGKVLAVASNGTLSYLATSYQGSVVAALDSTGEVGVTASQLYVPYGGIRSQSGTLPTDEGYTGQRRDASTGLDYYGARYYDPTVGQFTSADTVLAGGLNRYGYVGGNPTTGTDPTGHMDKPSANDPNLQTLFNELWRDTALWGDKSSMWALMVIEAVDGRQIGRRWHYAKVWAAKNGLEKWVQRTCTSPDYLIACRTGTSSAIDADLVTVALVLDYIYKALKAWEGSSYRTGTDGQNPPSPVTSARPLPAPSPGMPVQSPVPSPKGIPAQPDAPAPVPGFVPKVTPRVWQLENRPTVDLPDNPGIAPTTVPVAPTSESPSQPGWVTGLEVAGCVLLAAGVVVLVVATAPAWVPAALVAGGVAAVVVGVGVMAASDKSNPHAMAA